MKSKSFVFPLVVALAAFAVFVPFLGHVHLFDWDEINFAECAREMIAGKNYSTVQIDFLPFWEKPPLFIWMQVLSMKVFGVNAFAARFPNAVCGVITLMTIYVLGRKIYDNLFAKLWVLTFAGSLLPAFYFHTGIIDPWFNLFIFLGIYHFANYTNEFPSSSTAKLFNRKIILSSFFIALAMMTKGPVALLVFGLCFLAWRLLKRKKIISWQHFFLFGAVAVLPMSVWFLSLALNGNGHLVIEFILYQVRLFSTEDAGHGGSFFYHWIVLLVGCFPASVFAIRALFKKADDTPFEKLVLLWMRILFWVVLLLFSIVKTKIIHYSSLCWFPLTYLAAYSVFKLSSGQFQWKKWMTLLLAVLSAVLCAAFLISPFIEHFKNDLLASGSVADRFAAGNLQAKGNWNGLEWIAGFFLLTGCAVAFYFLMKKKLLHSAIAFFAGTFVGGTLGIIMIAPRVEEYSQHAVIKFWEQHADGSYLETIGYKSYAQYFYGNLQPGIENDTACTNWCNRNRERLWNPALSVSENEIAIRREWMLKGNIDKPAYFACKNTFEDEVKKYYPDLEKTGEENGFVFWRRMPKPFIFYRF